MAAATDVAALAVAPEPVLEPGTVRITVKATGKSQTDIVATADTTVGEILAQACADLEVRPRDRGSYALMAAGELLADPAQPIGHVIENLGSSLHARMVKKPEAGGDGACPS
jgi:hypothetical protein